MDSWARRSRQPAPVRSLTMPSGIEEAAVGNGEPKKTKTLEVRVVFEPSRIAPTCMVQAYERVVPIVRRGTTVGRDGRGSCRGETGHRSGAAR
jgi:hypothetical protein